MADDNDDEREDSQREDDQRDDDQRDDQRDGGRRRGERRTKSSDDGRISTVKLTRRACRQFAELSGRDIESVVSLAQADDGWRFGIEVLEIARVPDTADVLAEYEVTTDRRGRVLGYERRRRYTRGATREDR